MHCQYDCLMHHFCRPKLCNVADAAVSALPLIGVSQFSCCTCFFFTVYETVNFPNK